MEETFKETILFIFYLLLNNVGLFFLKKRGFALNHFAEELPTALRLLIKERLNCLNQ